MAKKKRFKDILKYSLKDFSLPIQDWENHAADRIKLRHSLSEGPKSAELTRTKSAETKRAIRKARVVNDTQTAPPRRAPHCGRGFRT